MILKRVIPILLFSNDGLYKTIKFNNKKYVGDPINAVRIFNDLGADEIIILDIEASKTKSGPNFDLIKNLAAECFMPLTYGGGIRTVQDAESILKLGVEKVCINHEALENPNLINDLSKHLGTSTIVASIDIKKSFWGQYRVNSHTKKKNININVVNLAKELAERGTGELLITNVDREGTQSGLDTKLIENITKAVNVPVIGHGGCGKFLDILECFQTGASAVACGSMFVFSGPHKAVLINYITSEEYFAINKI